MNDKELETMIYKYFDNEVPQPNKQILDELKTKMHESKTSSTKRHYNKFRLALVSCMMILLIIPAVSLPFVLHNFFPSDTSSGEEIYYSDSNLTMVDFSTETLNDILVGDFSKYSTLLEDYTINFARGYYGENNTLVYLNVDMNKDIVPFTKVVLNIVFVENYEHEFSENFKGVNDFTQYDNCKLYENEFTLGYKKVYYKFFEFEDYKVYLQLDKKDSSIINAITQG